MLLLLPIADFFVYRCQMQNYLLQIFLFTGFNFKTIYCRFFCLQVSTAKLFIEERKNNEFFSGSVFFASLSVFALIDFVTRGKQDNKVNLLTAA